MFLTTQQFHRQKPEIKNPSREILYEVEKGKLFRLKRGLYTNDKIVDVEYLSSLIYGPSYISFEYACSYYGLIPEDCFVITCAVTKKNKTKIYRIDHCAITFRYTDVPYEAFNIGLRKIQRGKQSFLLASPEKALCDYLYRKVGYKTMEDIQLLLFDDLRINEEMLDKMDKTKLLRYSALYPSSTLKTFSSYLRKRYGI